MFTEEILQEIFEVLGPEVADGLTFEEWAESHDWAHMTDQEIYNALPSEFLPLLSDFGLNASWMHDYIPAS